jgi:hypothetical protein
MADKPSDIVQGTLDMLILRTLPLEPMQSGPRLWPPGKRIFRKRLDLFRSGPDLRKIRRRCRRWLAAAGGIGCSQTGLVSEDEFANVWDVRFAPSVRS